MFLLARIGGYCTRDFGAITFGPVALGCTNDSPLGEGVNTCLNRPTAGVIVFRENNADQMKLQAGGDLFVNGCGEFRPISFTWKMDGSRDLGLVAEDVARIDPLLVTHNDKRELEGLRYDGMNVGLVNAIKQQRAQAHNDLHHVG